LTRRGTVHAVGVPCLLLPTLRLAFSHMLRMLAASTRSIPTTAIVYAKAGSGQGRGIRLRVSVRRHNTWHHGVGEGAHAARRWRPVYPGSRRRIAENNPSTHSYE
jgi:hypothetical protein